MENTQFSVFVKYLRRFMDFLCMFLPCLWQFFGSQLAWKQIEDIIFNGALITVRIQMKDLM